MSGILELVIAIVLACVAGWLAWRAWHSRQTLVRFAGGVVTVVVTLVLVAVALVGLVGVYRLYTPHGGPAPTAAFTVSSDQIGVAAKRANGCVACHSTSGAIPLDGGTSNFFADSPLGVLVSPNLTPGGPLKGWSDGEILRAIREGVDRDGHPLLIMPAETFHNLADSDAQAMVVFVRSQPASPHATPQRDISLLGLLLVGAGLFPTAEQPPITQPQTAPPAAVTPEYGKYLVDITGCRVCHGATLQGGSPGGFGPPAGPNIAALVPTWQADAFVSFFRTGVDPYGRAVDASLMPWKDIGKAYTDDELRAIYRYLQSPGT